VNETSLPLALPASNEQRFAAKGVYVHPTISGRHAVTEPCLKGRMMKTLFSLAVAAISALAGFVPPGTAEAAPKRVEGSYCESPLPSGTWVGYFSGLKPYPIISGGDDRYVPVTRRACFSTKADCVAWKYWMQTDYPQQVRTAWCRRK
jgi:hypothetical protein